MIADSAARLEALDVTRSFIVQAPAGSGKTELLIQRYLKLLETVDAPDAVVAITFTRKAAGEMRSRVIEALRAARGGEEPAAEHERLTFRIACDVLDRDRQLGWDLLRNPARLRIETIDALCASITRRMPWLARFGAMPEITEKAEDLYREAARNTLSQLEGGHEGLAYILLHLDNDFQRARQLIVEMLERREQWLRDTHRTQREDLEAAFQQVIADELAQLRGMFPRHALAEIAFLCELERFPEPSWEHLAEWIKIAELLLTKEGQLRRRPAHALRARCEDLFASLENEKALLESLHRVRKLPDPHFSATQWQAVEAAVSVLKLAVAELQLVFRERGRVDFAELAIRASQALGAAGEPEDLALALGERIRHVLVDEFQDTSITQFELIEKLTAGWQPGDGRTLFLVGDPMQSIYRFRQADVGLFLKARNDGIGAVRLEPLKLSVNFRSQPEIVGWINRTFESVFPPVDDLESGAIAYSASVPGAVGADARIGIHSFREAKEEADRVMELVASQDGGSIAVLVRSRTHLIEIVAELRRRRIAFQAIEIDQLGERQVIEDLMALTFALLHAADRVSWLAILRAPWCGLTLEDLHALAAEDHPATVWDLLHRRPLALSEDGPKRIERILPTIEMAIEARGRQPLREWVETTWMRLGGPACVEDETALEDAAAYFDLLERLSEGADLGDFDRFRDQVNALFAQPNAAAGNSLQLMTIHKAKGLEFDTVILPGLNAVPRSDDPRLLLWLEHRGEFLLAPIGESGGDKDPIYDYLTSIERRKSDQETARLLYVAATRGRRSLHLLACMETKTDGTIARPKSSSFLKLLWPVLGDQFADPASGASVEPSALPQAIRRFPAGWRVPEPPPPVHWTRVERSRTSAAAVERTSERARRTGAALHVFLQRIARESLDSWDENAVLAKRGAYRAVLVNLGVAAGDLDWAMQRIESGLLGALRDPRGRWLLGRHADAASELAVAGLIEGELSEGIIDRTFVDENGVRWIVDFKTSTHDGAGIENFLEQEKERYREQLERYARLMSQRDQRPIRLGLYFPLLGEWLEWAASMPLRKQALLFEM